MGPLHWASTRKPSFKTSTCSLPFLVFLSPFLSVFSVPAFSMSLPFLFLCHGAALLTGVSMLCTHNLSVSYCFADLVSVQPPTHYFTHHRHPQPTHSHVSLSHGTVSLLAVKESLGFLAPALPVFVTPLCVTCILATFHWLPSLDWGACSCLHSLKHSLLGTLFLVQGPFPLNGARVFVYLY